MIPNGEAHVWIIDADVEAPAEALTAEERERAARFRFDVDRRRWIAARVALRRVLARYTDDLNFVAGEHGKPYLANGAVHFNLSHSGALAVIAVAASEVGVDVEQIRESFDFQELDAAARSRAEFFRGWTRKEAMLKARGVGLGGRTGDGGDEGDGWVEELTVREGYAAAIASAGPHLKIVVSEER